MGRILLVEDDDKIRGVIRDYFTAKSEGDFEILKKSVNPTRLKNNPVELDEDTIDMLYHKILK